MNGDGPPPAVVDFVLRHVRVRTNVCTLQRREDGYTLDRRRVPDYNLIFVTRGRVVWVIAGEPVELEPHHLLLVPPAVPHHGYSMTRAMTLGSVHVDADLPGGRPAFEMLAPPRRQPVSPASRLGGYLRSAMEEFDRPDPGEARLMLASWGRLLTLELLRDNAARGILTHRPPDARVVRVMENLHHRWRQPTRLAEVAEEAGFSPQHLNRLFQRMIGITPLQYLTRLRLERAGELLLDQRWTVAAIAEQVGYEDPYYFSRLFKKHFGRSPAQYREAGG